MNPKHDRTHSRTAADIERKYDLANFVDQSKKIKENNIVISQLNQALSQFIALTNAEIAELKEKIGGTTLIENVYPVGAIYISVDSTNPTELFKLGTWEQIKDSFLLAAGERYEGGSTGTLESSATGSEMPPYLAVYVWKRMA